MDVRNIIGRPDDGEPEEGAAAFGRDSTGAVRIDCRDCALNPDPVRPECIRCVSAAISRLGDTDCIILSKVRDMQISRDAAELLCRLSSVMGAPVKDPEGKYCEGCERRPTDVVGKLWEGFPDPSFDEASSRVWIGPGEDPECMICLQRTSMLIRNAERGLKTVREMAAEMSGRRWNDD